MIGCDCTEVYASIQHHHGSNTLSFISEMDVERDQKKAEKNFCSGKKTKSNTNMRKKALKVRCIEPISDTKEITISNEADSKSMMRENLTYVLSRLDLKLT